MNRIRNTLAAVLVLQAASALAPAHALDKLKVAIGGRGLGETGISERGQMQGIFKKHGIELDVFYTAGTGETQQAIISGSAEIGIAAGIGGVLGAYAKGAPLRVIGASYTGDSLYWYVPADSPIRTPQDAAGKTVAYSTHGSPTHSAVLQLQKHLGVQFKPTATGPTQATYTQVLSKQIDVGWSAAPFLVEAAQEGKIRMLWRASEIPALADQTTRLIIANADFLAKNKDLIARYMDAYREAAAWLLTPEGIADYAVYASIPPAAAKQAMQDFVTAKAVDPDRISDVAGAMETAVQFKYLPAPLSADQLKELIQIPPRRK
jgi:NitT/TauT family transport system substrate-binding protein